MKRQWLLFLVAIQFLTRLPVRISTGSRRLAVSIGAFFPLSARWPGWAGSASGGWVRCIFRRRGGWLDDERLLLLTGAFHEDGFADVCDGFGGGRTRDAVLSIMKDSRSVPTAHRITMILGLKWSTLVSLPQPRFPPSSSGRTW